VQISRESLLALIWVVSYIGATQLMSLGLTWGIGCC
jgi:hypothetical protein